MAERDPDDPARHDSPGSPDPADSESDAAMGPLPHPLDRLWAHPSELGGAAAEGPDAASTPAPAGLSTRGQNPRGQNPRGQNPRARMLAGVLCGALATLGVVVAVGGFRDTTTQPRTAFVPAFPELGLDRTAGMVAAISTSVVIVRAGSDDATRTGTGIVLGDDRILTNASLVTDDEPISVTTSDGTVAVAELRGKDPGTDLAVLVADGLEAPDARIGSADGVTVGTWVLAVGASASQRRWASQGIVSGVDLVLDDPAGHVLTGMLGTDITGTPGTGGGPLLDETGAVVAILSRSSPGHAVPIDVARTVADQLATAGKASHGWLGAFAIDETSRDGGGALVVSVVDASPAHTAGLEPRDIVTAVGELPVTDVAGLMSMISRLRPGDPVDLTVWRDGRHRRLDASLGARPEDAVGLAALQA